MALTKTVFDWTGGLRSDINANGSVNVEMKKPRNQKMTAEFEIATPEPKTNKM